MIVIGCLGLLVLAILTYGIVSAIYYVAWIKETRWTVTKVADDASLEIGVRFPELERRPMSSPIPTIPALEYSLPRSVAFAFYDLEPEDSVTILSVRRRYDPDSQWVSVATESANLTLSPDSVRAEGTRSTAYFEIAPNQPSVQYVEFELRFQVRYVGRGSVPTEGIVVYRFQREERSGLRFSAH